MGKEEFGQYDFDDTNNPCGLTLSQLQELMDYYLYDYMGLTSSQVSYTTTSSDVKAFTIQKVRQGIPVLIRMGSAYGGGHAFIVYDYDEANDELYGHWGWQTPNHEHIKISSTEYNSYWDATVLNVNLSHSCSDNCRYSSNDNSPSVMHCPCEFSFHPSYHVHSYQFTADSSGTTHTKSCSCGVSITENHSYTKKYVRKNGTSHTSFCVCGASQVEVHQIASGSRPPYKCLLCKGLADAGFSQIKLSLLGPTIITNGNFVLPNGITVVV